MKRIEHRCVSSVSKTRLRPRLLAEVEEPPPISAWASAANNRNPGIGAVRREVGTQHRSLLGWGDQLEARIGRTESLSDSSVSYCLPIPGTRFTIQGSAQQRRFARHRTACVQGSGHPGGNQRASFRLKRLYCRNRLHTFCRLDSTRDKASETLAARISVFLPPGIAEGEIHHPRKSRLHRICMARCVRQPACAHYRYRGLPCALSRMKASRCGGAGFHVSIKWARRRAVDARWRAHLAGAH